MGKIHGVNLKVLMTWLNQQKLLQRDIQRYIQSEHRKRALVPYKSLCYEIILYKK